MLVCFSLYLRLGSGGATSCEGWQLAIILATRFILNFYIKEIIIVIKPGQITRIEKSTTRAFITLDRIMWSVCNWLGQSLDQSTIFYHWLIRFQSFYFIFWVKKLDPKPIVNKNSRLIIGITNTFLSSLCNKLIFNS